MSKLLCGTVTPSDALRYGRRSATSPSHLLQFTADKKPIVAWNSTQACNLACVHCYYTARAQRDADDLAQFRAPVLLFSGGEPFLRDDLYELGAYAVERGLRTVISTNGTLIDRRAAQRIREARSSYVGVSLDGIQGTNGRFRGVQGAFDAALAGLRHCAEAGVRIGLRLTLNRHNVADLNAIFDLLEAEKIRRACFYHLVYAGRGKRMQDDDLTLAESRAVVDLIFERSEDLHARKVDIEILTVDNHADGPYLLQRVQERGPERAAEVLQLLRWNGGNASGVGIADVDHLGNVHADQFWQHYAFGNVRERPFREIYQESALFEALRDLSRLEGKCGACEFIRVCGGCRARAYSATGNALAAEPFCTYQPQALRSEARAGQAET